MTQLYRLLGEDEPIDTATDIRAIMRPGMVLRRVSLAAALRDCRREISHYATDGQISGRLAVKQPAEAASSEKPQTQESEVVLSAGPRWPHPDKDAVWTGDGPGLCDDSEHSYFVSPDGTRCDYMHRLGSGSLMISVEEAEKDKWHEYWCEAARRARAWQAQSEQARDDRACLDHAPESQDTAAPAASAAETTGELPLYCFPTKGNAIEGDQCCYEDMPLAVGDCGTWHPCRPGTPLSDYCTVRRRVTLPAPRLPQRAERLLRAWWNTAPHTELGDATCDYLGAAAEVQQERESARESLSRISAEISKQRADKAESANAELRRRCEELEKQVEVAKHHQAVAWTEKHDAQREVGRLQKQLKAATQPATEAVEWLNDACLAWYNSEHGGRHPNEFSKKYLATHPHPDTIALADARREMEILRNDAEKPKDSRDD